MASRRARHHPAKNPVLHLYNKLFFIKIYFIDKIIIVIIMSALQKIIYLFYRIFMVANTLIYIKRIIRMR